MAMMFPNLEQIMLNSGFGRGITSAALEWLDISKERDMAILNSLTVQDIDIERKYTGDYRAAFRKDVIPHGSDELYQRFILMSYKLLDAKAYKLTEPLFWDMPDMDKKKFGKLTENAMKEVWGDEAQARALAVCYTGLAYYSGVYHNDLPTDPELYVKAAELTSDTACITRLMLCANAFEYMPLPEGGKLSDEAKRALAVIKEIMSGDIEEDSGYLLLAIAPASFFDEELKAHFCKYAAEKANLIFEKINTYIKHPERTLDAFFSADGTLTYEFLLKILERSLNRDMFLRSAAKVQTELFKSLMLNRCGVCDMIELNNVLRAVKPDDSLSDAVIKTIAMEKTAEATSECFEEKDRIRAYLDGKIPFDEIWDIVKNTKRAYKHPHKCDYIGNFGEDDLIMRCIAVLAGGVGCLWSIPGLRSENLTGIADKLIAVGVNIVQALDICGNILEHHGSYNGELETVSDSFSAHIDEIASADISECNSEAKIVALALYKNGGDKYRRQIAELAGDKAKAVRETAAEIIIKHPDWNDDIKSLLKAKKSSARDFALTIIERQGAKAYIPELKEALSAEKTDKLKARIGSMLAVVSGDDGTVEKASAEDIVKEMTKGKKTAKLDWLFTEPFSPVHKKDGTEADVSYIKALMLCFANSVGLKDPNADIIVSELVSEDVCRFANEVLNRWLITPPEVKSEWAEFFQDYNYKYAETLNAQAKYKWVFYLASVYGGKQAMDTFDELMAHWPLMQKGGLAKEIPHAIVLNGSSEYIMKVEKMSRKHRFNSIRKASADALLCAAEKLGMSKEEFADLMVPDLDFDENMCRTFDYGSRRFQVYISPKLEPEIYCDGKRLKSMPKPAASDEKSLADAAYKEFTAMKKQMKSVVASQLIRLENTMRTARNWNSENWKKLFVANPIMHRFAIGLIWGIYKDDKLEKSFRYLDDGSFTTVDDEELTVPEDAQIGLVHPIELCAEELSAWKQQLKDYDIVQPFPQLDRSIFKPTDEEKNADSIERFKGRVITTIELAGAMERIGWRKGTAGDGARIDEFLCEDIFSRNNGIKTSLMNSGMCAEVYRNKDEEITIESLYFYRVSDGERIIMNELRDRYFSEIMYQLNKVFG